MVNYDKLRYKLMPYIYTLAAEAYFDNSTIMRGLVMDFNDDPRVHDIADQYMFGPSILVNPVTEYKARKRDVYLPAGTGWYDFNTSKYYEGGQTLSVDATLEQMPLFIREGAIVLSATGQEYTSQDPETIYIDVYQGKDGEFNYYEDEGTNYNYEQNAFSIIPIRYDEKEKTITIGRRFGEFESMKENRKFIIRRTDREKVGIVLKTINYNGEEISITL